jgi:SAM-dependent methyltransferase
MTTNRHSSDAGVVDRARRYYDANTRGFLRSGHGRATGAIHRAVWAPGVTSRDQALRYVDERIAALARQLPTTQPLHLVDLGCGVGATLCCLLQSLPHGPVGTGITISDVQIAIARERAAAASLDRRATWIRADFCALPPALPPADLAYAIESFVHAPDAGVFFREAARLVRKGGLLVLCDDVLRDSTATAARVEGARGGHGADDDRGEGETARRTIEAFKRGWRITSLLDRTAIARLAAEAGFSLERTDDLTRYLELRRPRDWVLAPIAAAAEALGIDTPRLGNIIGGTALQRALLRGWIGYELLVFRRIHSITPAARSGRSRRTGFPGITADRPP